MNKNFKYSTSQLQLLQDASLIYEKNELLQQIEKQLIKMGKTKADEFPALTSNSPLLKVSKGEKHEGLPFLVLDYPRIFSKKDIFAIRCLLWWGKQISLSLLLKGKYLENYLPEINKSLQELKQANIYVETKGDIWQHKLNEADKNYQLPIEKGCEFLKISFKLPINQLNELDQFYQKYFNTLLNMTPYGQKNTSRI